jgi:predicted SAM-dependent methyltransferase
MAGAVSLKQRLGTLLFRKMPISQHVFDHFRLEINALIVRISHRINPYYVLRKRELRRRNGLLVNVGCGPFGLPNGWVNLDLAALENIYLRTDCRRQLPMADSSCRGIHVEMFLEHLDPFDEVPVFLREIYRCLETNGVARFIVPDAALFIEAYINAGWDSMNEISYGSEDWSKSFASKMDALNHIFQQGYEHYGGWDFERLKHVLHEAGFSRIRRCIFSSGDFPLGAIDRDFHRKNGLYVEARK